MDYYNTKNPDQRAAREALEAQARIDMAEREKRGLSFREFEGHPQHITRALDAMADNGGAYWNPDALTDPEGEAMQALLSSGSAMYDHARGVCMGYNLGAGGWHDIVRVRRLCDARWVPAENGFSISVNQLGLDALADYRKCRETVAAFGLVSMGNCKAVVSELIAESLAYQSGNMLHIAPLGWSAVEDG